jgi:nucleotide sugar dehydrogenase
VTVTVIGLGKIGLPLAVHFAKQGENVLGVDQNSETVSLINSAQEPFPGEENLQRYLQEVIQSGKLKAYTNTEECVAESNVVVVVVPLFIDSDAIPDFKSIDSATEAIAKGIKRGTLVCYETTLPVGTTRDRFTRKIEEISGLKVGIDFFVVFSPERVLTGRVFQDLGKYPKLVGGVTDACAVMANNFYSRVLEFTLSPKPAQNNGVWVLDSAESAEFAKLAETTYRDVNIALANQFAIYADQIGVDIYQVIEAANSQPYSLIHQPGISVGGHCIPIYPKFLLQKYPGATIVKAAREQNERMPKYITEIAFRSLKEIENPKVAILGLSYRSGVKETYNSGAILVAEEIKLLGGRVSIYDPLYTTSEIEKLGLESFNPDTDQVDCIIIHNQDLEYIEIVKSLAPFTKVIVDGRNLLKGEKISTKIISFGGGR